MTLSRRRFSCAGWARPAHWQRCRRIGAAQVALSGLPSSTTKSRRTSITPAMWLRTTSACNGLNCAACGTKTSPISTPSEIAQVARHPGEIQAARDRYRQPALQGRLARRAAVKAERTPRPVPRRLRFQAAGRAAGALHRARQDLPHRPHSLLRFLAARQS